MLIKAAANIRRGTMGLLVAGVSALILSCGAGSGAPSAGGAGDTASADETGNTASTDVSDGSAAAETPIDPRFALTPNELATLVAELPEEIVTPILSEPRRFLDDINILLDTDRIQLVLADKEHTLPAEYAPDDLVDLTTHADRLALNREDLSLRSVILSDLFAMVDDAAAQGIVLDVSSSYRSYAYQEWLFQYWVDELGLEEAERVSARPGTSQHQLGTTIDFGSVTEAFADTPAGIWLAENAWRYGFSLSYPDGYEELTGYAFEPWHYRWIGRDAARIEHEHFGGIQQRMLVFLRQHREYLQQSRTSGESGT